MVNRLRNNKMPRFSGCKDLVVLGNDMPGFPESFNARLQRFDKDLLIVWHKPPTQPKHKPGRWKVEMCTQHLSGKFRANGKPEHDHTCRRVYVMMVQDEQGTPMPLGDHVFTKLAEMRSNSEAYGGQTERGLRNFIAASDAIDKALEAKREDARRDLMEHNRKFNRRQFNKLHDLVQRHDMRPNK